MVELKDYLLQNEINQTQFAELSNNAEQVYKTGEYPLSYGTILKIYNGEKVSTTSCIKSIRAIKLWLTQKGYKGDAFVREVNKIHFV